MLETKKVFISGPMTGYPNWNRHEFDRAEKMLEQAGFTVFNPCCLLAIGRGWNDQDIAAIDLAALGRCNYIYQLDGWSKSKGASAEWQAALWMGLKVINNEWLEWYIGELVKREKAFEENRQMWQKAADEMYKERVEDLKKQNEELEKVLEKNTIKLSESEELKYEKMLEPADGYKVFK